MTIWTKFGFLFLCAAICAFAVTILPRENAVRNSSPPAAAPVMLHDRAAPHWLLV